MLMQFRAAIAAAAFVILSGNLAAAAADATLKPLDRPAPASVSVPNLAFTPTRNDVKGYDSHYYFHKPGVSYEKAFADLDQCRIYIRTSSPPLLAEIPKFAPLDADSVARKTEVFQEREEAFQRTYGLVGVIIANIAIGNVIEEFAIETINRCMAYKGYSRYGTSRAIWDQINKGSEAEKFARMALIASGPQPTTEAIAP